MAEPPTFDSWPTPMMAKPEPQVKLPPPPKTPEIAPPPVVVSSHQVWSAAIQNIVICLILGVLMYTNRISQELGGLLLAAVAGIDLVGRKRVKSDHLMALAFGATSIMSKTSHYLLAALAALTIGGCSTLDAVHTDDLDKALQTAQEAYERAQASYEALCVPVAIPELQGTCDKLSRVLGKADGSDAGAQ